MCKLSLCKTRIQTNYLERYCGQTLGVNEDVADRNQDGLTGWRKTQENWVVEIGGRMPRIEIAGNICLRRPRPILGCTADDDDDNDKDRNSQYQEATSSWRLNSERWSLNICGCLVWDLLHLTFMTLRILK
jgi:hypothetical protein